MNKNIFIALGSIILIVIVGAVLFAKDSTSPVNVSEEETMFLEEKSLSEDINELNTMEEDDGLLLGLDAELSGLEGSIEVTATATAETIPVTPAQNSNNNSKESTVNINSIESLESEFLLEIDSITGDFDDLNALETDSIGDLEGDLSGI